MIRGNKANSETVSETGLHDDTISDIREEHQHNYNERELGYLLILDNVISETITKTPLHSGISSEIYGHQ